MESLSIRFPEFDLAGKVALVTGAGRGIGYHIALALARYGADLVVCSRTVSELEKVGKEIEEIGRRVLIRQADVRKASEVSALVQAAVDSFQRIDILVNNAGVNIPQWAAEVTEEAWDTIMDINLKGVFFVAQAVGKVMIRQKRGKIINVSSQAGSVGLLRRAAYCASKGGVNQLTRVLATEWAPHNINVNAIAPTFVETPLTRPMFQDQNFREYVMGNISLGRIGKPEDIVGAAIYLASAASDLVTGHVLLIDGGWTAH
jgi:2-deoxy-D-gluconate 3-dehydrogenase